MNSLLSESDGCIPAGLVSALLKYYLLVFPDTQFPSRFRLSAIKFLEHREIAHVSVPKVSLTWLTVISPMSEIHPSVQWSFGR